MNGLFSRWGRDTSGSIALMFGLVAFVLVGVIGAAIDYSRAANVQSTLQRAIDGAVLIAAKNRDSSGSYATGEAIATDFIKTALGNARLDGLSVKVSIVGDRVRLEAAGQVPTTIANVLGVKSVPISGSADAIDTRVEIALVLDNTGSMKDLNKLPTLKTAATNFLNKMQSTAGGPDSVKIAIVPFDTDVNLGSLKSSWWVDMTNSQSWNTNPQTAGCVWDRKDPYGVSDAAPNLGFPDSLYSADSTRTSACNLAPIVPLTTDFSALRSSIAGMTAAGTTNLTIGLAWGYHVLTRSEPITGAADFGTSGLVKYIILMTDGYNTKDRFSTDVTQMNARTRQACSAAKGAGIRVFTAGIIKADLDLLRDCASDPTMSYNVQTVDQLDPVFDSIYRAITGMRIAR